jgi:hypothetical protein
MSKTKQAAHVQPVTKGPKITDDQKVTLTRDHTTSAKNSPDWANAADVQTAFAKWNTAADSIESNGKTITQLRKQLADAESQQRVNRLSWSACAQAVLIAVAIYAAGAAKTIVGLGFGTRMHASLGPLPAVLGLKSLLGRLSGQTIVEWTRGLAKHGFLVQHATDPANQATWSVPTPCTKSKITVEGLPPGSTVHVRVCAIDPSQKGGQAPWSDWIAATAR